MASSTGNAVVSAVDAVTQDLRVRLAMIFGATEEGGLTGPWGTSPGGAEVGDSGTSFGPWQIHLTAHPGVSAQQAASPSWAARYMVGSYTSGVKGVPDSLWRTNPALAAEQAAYAAERPAKSYLDNYGMGQVASHYATAAAAEGGKAPTSVADPGPGAGGAGVPVSPTSSGTSSGFGGGIGGAFMSALVGPVPGLFGATSIRDMVERAALIIFGGLLIIVGLLMLVKDTGAADVAKTVGLAEATGGASTTVQGAARAGARSRAKNRAQNRTTRAAGKAVGTGAPATSGG